MAFSRDEAWAKFNEARARMCVALGDKAEVDNSLPKESSEEVTKMLRSEIEYTVSDDIEVTFEPARIGEVLLALLECELHFITPTFVFDKLPKVTPELLAEAAATAKLNAAGVVAGVGARIGRLVSINVGPPQLKTVYRPWTTVEPTFNTSLFSALSVVNAKASPFESWEFDEEKLATYDTEVQVTVEYEVIEDEIHTEVAR
jgi:hypothetical protein